MKDEKTTPLRQRMIEDMHIRGLGEKTQKAHIRNVKHFAAFLGRAPDTATPEDLRTYQLQMTNDGVSAIEACRTEALGGYVADCAKCGHHHVAYNSCLHV